MKQEKQVKSAKKVGWNPLQVVGLVLSVLGILMLAYSAYSFFSGGARVTYPAGSFRHTPGVGFNGTAPNGTAFNTAYYSGRATGASSRLYPILSGVLMLLLGVTVFKYGKLKASIVR